jgi:hypothetical protein
VNRIANGWHIATASWRVLSRDRELIAVPVVAAIAAGLAFAAVAGPGFLLLGGSDAASASDVALWLVLVAASVVATWVVAIGSAAVVAGAAERMGGGEPTLGSAFAAARARAGRLLGWAVLATVVSIILDQLEQRLGAAGRVVSFLAGTAFSVVSFLALPVIVFEDVGAVEGLKRSARLLRSTWGEQLTFSFGLGLLGFVAVLPAVAVAVGAIASGVLAVQVAGVVLAVAWIVVVMAITSALSAVFKAALYRWSPPPSTPVSSPAPSVTADPARRPPARPQRGGAAAGVVHLRRALRRRRGRPRRRQHRRDGVRPRVATATGCSRRWARWAPTGSCRSTPTSASTRATLPPCAGWSTARVTRAAATWSRSTG